MYRIFLSSPGDVLAERNRAAAVIDRLNAEHPGQPMFSLTRWEESFYTATTTFQDQITSPGEHHLVVFIFWKKLGSDLPPQYNRADGTSRTGTEYEFEEARDARERRVDNLPDIIVYRKSGSDGSAPARAISLRGFKAFATLRTLTDNWRATFGNGFGEGTLVLFRGTWIDKDRPIAV
jgi:hypothetical protein